MGTEQMRSAPLTADTIIELALGYVERGELESMSLRKLAQDLGVTPMALYRHIKSKDELMLEVTDVLLSRKRLPARPTDWQRFLKAIADSLRSLLVEYPDLINVFARQPVTTPTARLRLTRSIAVLQDAGFTRDGAIEAYAAVHTYTLGFCSLEAARRRHQRSDPPPDNPEALAIRRFVSDRQYRIGVDAILAGVASAQGVGANRR